MKALEEKYKVWIEKRNNLLILLQLQEKNLKNDY